MATQFDYLADGMHSNLGVNLNRQKYAPLDGSSVFKSIADFEYYIKKGAYDQGLIETAPSQSGIPDYVKSYMTHYPYVGQIVSIVENGTVKVYKITDVAACTYEQIDTQITPGSLPIATRGSLGGVIVGTGVDVGADGTISVAPATATTVGGVKIGQGIDVAPDGTISAAKVTVDLDFSAASSDNPIATSAVHERLLSSESKLSGIAEGAEVNVISGIYLNGSKVEPGADRNVQLTTKLVVSVEENSPGSGTYVASHTLAQIAAAWTAGQEIVCECNGSVYTLNGHPTSEIAQFVCFSPGQDERLLNGSVVTIYNDGGLETVTVEDVDSDSAAAGIAVDAVKGANLFVPLSVASANATDADKFVISSEVSSAISQAVAGIAGAMHFRGAVTPNEGETDLQALARAVTDPASGDVAVITTTSKEYLYNKPEGQAGEWVELGDEILYATKAEVGTISAQLTGDIAAVSSQVSAFDDMWKTEVDSKFGDLYGYADELSGTTIPGITSDISGLSDAVSAIASGVEELSGDLSALADRLDKLSVSQLVWDIDEIDCGDSGYVAP